MTLQDAKRELRIRMLKARAAIPPAVREDLGRAAQERLMGLEAFRRARRVGCYASAGSEMPTARIIAACWVANVEVCVPAWFGGGGAGYRFVPWVPGDATKAGMLGIREPANKTPVETSALDLVIVPGVAFDARGHRLGHGAGHYDRLLGGAPGVIRIGFCFELQVADAVPVDAHDVGMDAVVTEQRVIRAGARNGEDHV